MRESGDEHSAIDVCRDYMGGFGEIACASYDIVAPGLHGLYEGHTVGAGITECNMVAHRDGVGGAYALDAEVALGETLDFSADGGTRHIVGSGISYYGCLGIHAPKLAKKRQRTVFSRFLIVV